MKFLNPNKKMKAIDTDKKEINAITPMIEPFVEFYIDENGNVSNTDSLYGVAFDTFSYTNNPNPSEEEVIARRIALEHIWNSRIDYLIGICVQNLVSSIYYKTAQFEEERKCPGFALDMYNEIANNISHCINDIIWRIDDYINDMNYYSRKSEVKTFENFTNMFTHGFTKYQDPNVYAEIVSGVCGSIAIDIYTKMYNYNFYKLFIKYGVCPSDYSMYDEYFCIFRDSLCIIINQLNIEKAEVMLPLSYPEFILTSNENSKRIDWTGLDEQIPGLNF